MLRETKRKTQRMIAPHHNNQSHLKPIIWPLVGVLLGCACSESTYYAPVDSDTAADTGTADTPETDCQQVLSAVIRDFTAAHPDFEREDLGWGPAQGLIKKTLDDDRKPIFNKIRGDCQLGDLGYCRPTEDWANIPMWGVQVGDVWHVEETFFTWYHDNDEISFPLEWYNGSEINRTIEKEIILVPHATKPDRYVFDSNRFFPLSTAEGFGESPEGSNKNYLFTTEIHTLFQYVEGQEFEFSGDDDLWIFVNGRLVLDLGGLHEPYEGAIDFGTIDNELGISPGGRYPMDIFHAERHTAESNFHIETNISCFVPVVAE